MTDFERQEARRLLKQQELSKTPEEKRILEHNKKRTEEERKRKEVLDNWAINGFYRTPVLKEETKQKTAMDMRKQALIEHFL